MAEYPNVEQLGPPSLKVEGFQLWVHNHQFPDLDDYDDGNWLSVTAHCGRAWASVWASGSFIQVMDIVGFGEQCEKLAEGKLNSALMDPYEPELRVELKKTDSLGHIEMTVQITPDHLTQEHEFLFEIDLSYLKGLSAQCREIEKKYPVRGLNG